MASSTWAHSPLARSHAVAVIGAEVLTDRTIPYGTARADQWRKYRMILVARLVARVCLTAPQTAYLSLSSWKGFSGIGTLVHTPYTLI
jgi:hypothetical protein